MIRIFPNEDSINRLIGTLLIEQHEKWISGKTYFNMDNYFDEKEQARKDAEMVRQKRITQIA